MTTPGIIRKTTSFLISKKISLLSTLRVLPVLFLASSPLQLGIAMADQGSGAGGNSQANILIQPVTPAAGETISGAAYIISANTPTVSTGSATLQYCLRPGEETTDLISAVENMADSGETSDAECTWTSLTPSGANSWTATLDTTQYTDGLYTIPFLLKTSGVSGQKYAFIKDVTIANNIAPDAAPEVALQTINVTHASRPTDAPIRGTALIQGKIVDTDLSSYELTIAPSDDTGIPTGSAIYDSGTVAQTTSLSAFTTLYEWDTTAVADGTYVVNLSAKDKAGNESTASLIRKVDNIKGGTGSDTSSEDGETGALQPIRPLANGYISGTNYLVQVQVTDPTLVFDSVVMRLQSGSGTEDQAAAASTSDPTQEEGNSPWMRMYYDEQSGYWEYQLDTTKYSDGLYWMHIRAESESGTVVTDVATSVRITNLTLDNTAPVVTLDQGNQTTKTPIHRKGGVQDTSGIASYQWSKLSGPGNVTFSQPNSLETDITADANGDYVIQLAVTDLAGNTGTASFTMTWYDPALVPTTPPTSTTTTTGTAAPSSGTVILTDMYSTLNPFNLSSTPGTYAEITPSGVTVSPSPSSSSSMSQPQPNSTNPNRIISATDTNARDGNWWIAIPIGLAAVGLLGFAISKRKVA